MATLYKVTTSSICVFQMPMNELFTNSVGTLAKNSTFYANDYDGSSQWKIITRCDSNNKYVGKYVVHLILSDGYNFVNAADSTSTTDSNTTDHSSTTPTTDENDNPVSRDDDGNIISTVVQAVMHIDDTFTRQYTKNMSSIEYMNNLKDGISVKHLRGILGIPHQFLPIADIRTTIGEELVSTNLGRVYTEKILKAMPLLLITPGIPSFMSGYSSSQKRNILTEWLSGAVEALQEKLTKSYSGKYYSLKYAYVEYFKYVNAMLRSAAIFLGIQDEKVDGKSLAHFNWLYDASGDDSDHWGKSGIGKF